MYVLIYEWILVRDTLLMNPVFRKLEKDYLFLKRKKIKIWLHTTFFKIGTPLFFKKRKIFKIFSSNKKKLKRGDPN